jgi:GR25 family glycosyltransferase involved in LPS biosynthesis
VRRPITIAILSYDRPHYLTQVLDSLAPQLNPLDRVYLFQDGAWNPHSGATKTDQKLIDECGMHFSRIIPKGKIILSETNLGVAGNYRRADEFVFVEYEAPYALFLEDDLVLSAHYLQIIDRLLKLAERRPSIGYVSAYGDLWASLESQRAAPGRLQPMHENWGSALTRQSWLKQKGIRDRYWELVKDSDYSQRDHDKIREFYRTLGYEMTISSQDGSRWVACAENDLARVTTTACHARYIGETGEHFDPGHYQRCKFAESVFYPDDHNIVTPSVDLIANWIDRERRKLRTFYVHDYLVRLLPEEVEAITPPHLRGTLG